MVSDERVQGPGRRPERSNLLTTMSLMVLIGIELFGVAFAGGWAIAGLFELGESVGYGLMLVFGLLAAWLMVQLWRKATAQGVA